METSDCDKKGCGDLLTTNSVNDLNLYLRLKVFDFLALLLERQAKKKWVKLSCTSALTRDVYRFRATNKHSPICTQ